ncbi:MAG: hypothetical protein ACUVTD_05660 [Nitrososphaerales archaeon]
MKKKRQEFDFYEIALRELRKINCKKRIIPFPLVFNRLGTIFHFDKETTKIAMRALEERGLIQLVPFKGIRILMDDRNKYS